MKISAAEFKAKCLKLMSNVQKYREDVVITKYGQPVAKLVPVDDEPEKPIFGFLKDSIVITGDIVKPIDEDWTVDG